MNSLVFMKSFRILMLWAGLLVVTASPLFSSTALELVESKLTEMRSIIEHVQRSSSLEAVELEDDKRRAKLIIEQTFDFNVLARRALGLNFREFTAAEYDEFLILFTDLLFTNYYNRIKDFTIEKVEYLGETRLSDSKAEVKTVVYSNGKAYPIDYRLYSKDDQWRVYDVIVEGVSMVNNYRSQFDRLLKSNDVASLLEKLKTHSEL